MKVLIALLFICCQVQADVQIEYTHTRTGLIFGPAVIISNKITAADYEKLSAQLNQKPPPGKGLGIPRTRIAYLNSDGGEVEAAIKIARLLRKYFYNAVIGNTSRCLSSCAIIFAASPNRELFPGGVIGVHRVFTNRSSEKAEQTAKDFDQLGSTVRAEFHSVGVSPLLWDLMLSVPPESMHVLSEKEISEFKLRGSSAAFMDMEEAGQAESLGISREELYKRKAKANNCRTAANYRSVPISHPDVMRQLEIYDACDTKARLNDWPDPKY